MAHEEALVQYIANHLVNDTEQVRVTKKVTSSSVIVELRVAQPDMGRVIGKNGRVANAIRSLLRVASSQQHDKRVILNID